MRDEGDESGLSGLFGLSGAMNKSDETDKPNRKDTRATRGMGSTGRLFGLQVVELLDEPLELGHGVVALVGSDLLIDGEGHGFDGGAHLVNGVLIGLRGGWVRIEDEQGTQFMGDAFGRAWLTEESQKFLLALLLVCGQELLGIGERKAPFSDLDLLVFGQGPKPVFQPVDGGVRPLFEPLRRRGLHEPRGFGVVLLQR